MQKRHVLATAAAAVLTVGLLAPPAAAETHRVVDGDDSEAKVDLLRTRVTHAPKQVRVRMVHDNLVRQPTRAGQWVTVFIDTDPDNEGPEYRFSSGLNSGTDYVLDRVGRWQGKGKRLTCSHNFDISWKNDVAVLRIARKCLGNPRTVAVAVKAEEFAPEGEEYVDWLTAPRAFTAPVARG